ncbi:MAG: hypothetical protein AW12_02123 [Candidatus Accumulibacter sp. BA-94]|uniref:cyanophycin metabolism-associated DUF1854 family protein n=1 Tax=Accumulibacter sp. TaxID=2053492 RepID=UPI000448812D|nr:DUF1854 domain-containing protein [Accumulibacter sp.]EXI86736.1 MAG: hypothetical protein AW12_02123 [Candidatus Accumulibacter sp. BA-94]MBL8392524.1 DUF1854 domain-containing protein [Accumulibacter sp.]HRD88403.1 DUF1854 domain-containing protein [Accumulibacter sp.]
MKVRPDYQLRRNSFGRLELTDADGESHDGVVPVRAFPITAPDDGLALVDPYGHELAWIDRLDSLPDDLRQLLEDELAGREFMPVIERIVGVGSFATPSTWEVDTDRGPTSFVLKGEEDIRRLASPALLIADSHGIQFLIRDRNALDQNSRRILDRFL